MEQYIGLDLSLKETAISVRQNGRRIWRGKCPSDPQLLAEVIRKRAPNAMRVVFETGPLSVWFYHGLKAEGMPAICIDARHAKAALDMAPNKTDANDADGLAHLAEVGFYREVRVKQYDSMLTRTLVGARGQLIKIVTELSNQIRGLMKTFGLVVPKGAGRVFEANVRRLLAGNDGLELVILPLLEAWRSVRGRAAQLDRQLVTVARESAPCRLTAIAPEAMDAKALLGLARDHWQIENRLFRVRDGTFAEDACRVRSGNAPAALAHLRDASLTLIRKRNLKPKPAREAFAANPKAAIRAVIKS
jgi:transposase